VNEWRKRDPLLLTEKLLKMSKTDKEAHQKDVREEMEAASEFAQNSPKATLESALEDVYA
jgi:TPP-dependent pyruvate/acetoin dehydrogenase alpha subunit